MTTSPPPRPWHRHVTPLCCVIISFSKSSGEATSDVSAEATPDLSAEEDSPPRNRAVARHAQNGRISSALAYRSLEDGSHGDEDATSQQERRFTVDDSGGRVNDEISDGGCELSVTAAGGEQRICGPGGLLSVPKVKPLLFLVCVVQVRFDYIVWRILSDMGILLIVHSIWKLWGGNRTPCCVSRQFHKSTVPPLKSICFLKAHKQICCPAMHVSWRPSGQSNVNPHPPRPDCLPRFTLCLQLSCFSVKGCFLYYFGRHLAAPADISRHLMIRRIDHHVNLA